VCVRKKECVRVCVREKTVCTVAGASQALRRLCVRVRECVSERVCVCQCVCVRKRVFVRERSCVYVCV